LRFPASYVIIMVVLDWAFEPSPPFIAANLGYAAVYLEDTLASLLASPWTSSGDTASFLHALRSGAVPPHDVRYQSRRLEGQGL
jgi:hypothetical protein